MSKKCRYCTIPKIPWFRDWFEDRFGDLCKIHDEEYSAAKTRHEKYESDFKFTKQIAQRGYLTLSILTLMAVNMPWINKNFK